MNSTKIIVILTTLSYGLFYPQKSLASQKPQSAKQFDTLFNTFELPTFSAGKPARTPNYIGIETRFGNKALNLCILHKLANYINNTVLKDSVNKMGVPEFMAMSHQEIEAYLDETMGLGKLWQEFIKAQANNKELSDDAVKILAGIRAAVKKSFNDDTQMPISIRQALDSYIKVHAQSLLMVRSTGYEDRIDIANAGGNESVPSVKPSLDDIWKAMGIVVESYFSEKSLKQRLLAGDIITGHFFIPVLIQRMIGETIWTGKNPAVYDIPISGVMFTQEAEGNTPEVTQIQSAFGHNQGVVNSIVAVDTYYVGHSGFIHPIIRKKKQRMVPMQKGVELVANAYDIQNKSSLDQGTALDLKKIADAVQKIYDYPTDIEYVIQKKNEGSTIYLVQARPLVQKKRNEPTYIDDAYIESIKQESAKTDQPRIVYGIALGIAGGYVRTISNADQLIIKDELPQALNEYHDNKERDTIKAVLVSKMAPSTSHEATQFRGYNVPILILNPQTKNIVEQWLMAGGSLLIDTQRALVIHMSSNLNEKEGAAVIKTGWYTHPIPMQASVMPEFMIVKDCALQKSYADYQKKLVWNKDDKDETRESMRLLIERIKKTTDATQITKNLKRIMHRLNTLFVRMHIIAKWAGLEGNTVSTKHLLEYVQLCAVEILYTVEHVNNTHNRLVYLYPTRFLEAALFQQHDDQLIQDGSYIQFLNISGQDLEARKKLISAAKKTDVAKIGMQTVHYEVQLIKVDKLALNDATQQQWDTFIKNLMKEVASASSKKERLEVHAIIRQLSTHVAQLQKLNVLDLWINSSFINEWRATQGKSALVLAKKLIDEIEEPRTQKESKEEKVSNKEVIAWVNNKQNSIETWERKVDQWGEPERFDQLWQDFERQFVSEFIIGTSPDTKKMFQELMFDRNKKIAGLQYPFLGNFAEHHAPLVKYFMGAPRLGKLVLMSFFKQIIDLYDRTIKSMTGSPNYKDKNNQSAHFLQMLVPYHALMEQMVRLIPEDDEKMIMEKAWPFSLYLMKIREILQGYAQNLKPNLLLPSKSFNANIAQIGSKIDYGLPNVLPKTLEDLFTLDHQNMVFVLKNLNKKWGIEFKNFPSFVQRLCASLESVSLTERKNLYNPTFVGSDYQYPALTVFYNMSLRQHSSTFEIQYKKNKNFSYTQKKPEQAVLTCRILGQNEENRMNAVVAYAHLAGLVSNIRFEKNPFTSTGVIAERGKAILAEFGWIVDSQTDLNKVVQYINRMLKATIDPELTSYPYKIMYEVNRIEKFLPDEIAKIFQTYNDRYLENMPQGDRKKMLEALHFSDLFFSQDLTFTAWFIQEYMMAGEYEKAFKLMNIAAQTIVREKKFMFDVLKVQGVGYAIILPLLTMIMEKLTLLFKETKNSKEMQGEMYEFAEKILSKKVVSSLLRYPINNKSWLIIPVVGLVQELLKIKKSAVVIESVDDILHNKEIVNNILKLEDEYKKLVYILLEIMYEDSKKQYPEINRELILHSLKMISELNDPKWVEGINQIMQTLRAVGKDDLAVPIKAELAQKIDELQKKKAKNEKDLRIKQQKRDKDLQDQLKQQSQSEQTESYIVPVEKLSKLLSSLVKSDNSIAFYKYAQAMIQNKAKEYPQVYNDVYERILEFMQEADEKNWYRVEPVIRKLISYFTDQEMIKRLQQKMKSNEMLWGRYK